MEIPSAGEQTCWITEVFIFTNPERSLSFVCSGKKKQRNINLIYVFKY